MFRDGYLTEASASNVFVVKNGKLLAPPKNHLILPGITYDVVLELARRTGMPLELRADPGGGSAKRRRDLGDVVDQGSAGGRHARRQAGRQRQARRGVQAHPPAYPGVQAQGDARKRPERAKA